MLCFTSPFPFPNLLLFISPAKTSHRLELLHSHTHWQQIHKIDYWLNYWHQTARTCCLFANFILFSFISFSKLLLYIRIYISFFFFVFPSRWDTNCEVDWRLSCVTWIDIYMRCVCASTQFIKWHMGNWKMLLDLITRRVPISITIQFQVGRKRSSKICLCSKSEFRGKIHFWMQKEYSCSELIFLLYLVTEPDALEYRTAMFYLCAILIIKTLS